MHIKGIHPGLNRDLRRRNTVTTQQFLSAADAARILNRTPAAIRAMVRRGALPVAAMTEGGMHLFRRKDVEAVARRRAERRQARERRGEGH
jgi:hypothetical protein